MNELHLQLLASPEWAQTLRNELFPWLAQAGGLGDNVLELGPGPGPMTDDTIDTEPTRQLHVDDTFAPSSPAP